MREVHRCQVLVNGLPCGGEIQSHEVACRDHWAAGSKGLQLGFRRLEATERARAMFRRRCGHRDPYYHYRREMALWRQEWAERVGDQGEEARACQ